MSTYNTQTISTGNLTVSGNVNVYPDSSKNSIAATMRAVELNAQTVH
jgi:hypothetical protein